MNFLNKLKNAIPGMPTEKEEHKEIIEVDGSDALNPNTLAKLAGDETTSIDDLLRALNIEKTFEIDSEVLFPGDLDGHVFSKQTPAGYDMSEVDHVVSKTDNSLRYYVDLLQRRNHDIHKLATNYLKLQAENNNLKLNNELGNGISIMTSGGDEEELERQLAEARLEASRLRDTVAQLESGGATISKDVEEDYRKRLQASEAARQAAERDRDDYLSQLMEYEDERSDKSFYEDSTSSAAALGDSAELLDSSDTKRDFDPFGNRRETALPDDGELPDLDLEIGEESDSYFDSSGRDTRFNNSAFKEDQYMNLDEFIDDNIPDAIDDDEGGFDFKFANRSI